MAITLDTIRSLDASKTYYLANSDGEIKEATPWQKFKCLFGIGDGREKAAIVIGFLGQDSEKAIVDGEVVILAGIAAAWRRILSDRRSGAVRPDEPPIGSESFLQV